MTGANLTLNSSGTFTIKIKSLSSNGTAGNLPGFDGVNGLLHLDDRHS